MEIQDLKELRAGYLKRGNKCARKTRNANDWHTLDAYNAATEVYRKVAKDLKGVIKELENDSEISSH